MIYLLIYLIGAAISLFVCGVSIARGTHARSEEGELILASILVSLLWPLFFPLHLGDKLGRKKAL